MSANSLYIIHYKEGTKERITNFFSDNVDEEELAKAAGALEGSEVVSRGANVFRYYQETYNRLLAC